MTQRRVISLPLDYMNQTPKFPGRSKVFSVIVDWPELRLTEEQEMANSIAMMNGEAMPYMPSGLIIIEVTPS